MSNKILIAIGNTGLPPLAVDSLSAQMHPEQTEVLVLQVFEPLVVSVPPEMSAGYAPEMAARKKELRKGGKEALTHAVDLLRKAGFKVESRLVESGVKEGILTVASEWGANLIVVTSHTRKGLGKFLHRSVAQSIVHSAPCSVLVLKDSAKKAAA
jgi:nucleotide-binding universal stress UspA family protein